MAITLEQDISAYDRHHQLEARLTMQWYPKRVVAQAKLGSMLDLGLGHGYTTQYFAKAFEEYTVIEGSSEIIQRFRQKFPSEEVNFVHSYFEDFVTERNFDAIGMGFILEHVENPTKIIKKFSRFLAPGGLLFIAVPNAESLHRRIGHEAGLLDDMTELGEADREFGHKRYFTLSSLQKLVEGQGLNILKIEGLLLKPLTTSQLSVLNLSQDVHQALLKVGVDYPEIANSILLTASIPANMARK